MLNIFKNMKYKFIAATMGIGLLASTGGASVVHASPVDGNPINTRPQVAYGQYIEGFSSQLDRMASNGFISSYQESRVLDILNVKENFKAGLDNLVATGVISGYQASTILDAFNNSAQPKAPGSIPVQPTAPQLYYK